MRETEGIESRETEGTESKPPSEILYRLEYGRTEGIESKTRVCERDRRNLHKFLIA